MQAGPFRRITFGFSSAAALFLTAQVPPANAQTAVTETSSPLSVIDWLGTQPDVVPVAKPPEPTLDEPAVTQSGLPPKIAVAPLGQNAPQRIGLVPSNITGLPPSLWAGSEIGTLLPLLEKVATPTLPAAQSLLYTLLLAEADAPGGATEAGDKLALARVRKLVSLGALDPALSLIEQAGVPMSAAHYDTWMEISLLTGAEDRACAVLRAAPHLTRDLGNRIFCAARTGQWENAALTFGSAQALGLIEEEKLALIDRFLHPESFEGTEPMPAPRKMDPLSFRLFEAIGEPKPTRMLPRAFAVADLRGIAGWKSQIEAAERLTRVGALPDNRLLGLYTDRQPAASGGVWDRVSALQRFETALQTGSAEAVAKTLPRAWRAMRNAGLEIAFANLFAAQLSAFTLDGRASTIASTVALLSSEYETAAGAGTDKTLAMQVATGDVSGPRPAAALPGAVHDAFNGAKPRADLVAMVQQSRLGESVLHILQLLEDGAQGNANALRDGIATLRAIGLEDTSRRASLQILLLDS